MNELERFIEKANKIHNNKFDYSKSIYTKSRSDIVITCPIHGDFITTPSNHLRSKTGCPKCNKSKKLDTSEFIRRAKKIHGNKYDYSKSVYINKSAKICIICPVHGEFWQKAEDHYRGRGCQKCWFDEHTRNQTWDTEKFIEKAKEKFGDKFDYSKVNYIKNDIKVEIICPIHGSFWTTPSTHLDTATGCPKCGREMANNSAALTQEEFIENAKKVHGDKYDYSLVKYTRAFNKVKIICPEHGIFLQRPAHHMFGQGCPECGKFKNRVTRKYNTEDFINKAKNIHGDTYDYSLVNYVDNTTRVTIICKTHGEFLQRPCSHLSGSGCQKCILKYQTKLFNKLIGVFPKEEFIWEYRSEWLGKQRIDICLEKYKIAIEYDGLQHFVPVDRFGGIEQFKKQLKFDALKEKKCKENGFKLYRLKYNYTDEDFYDLCKNIELAILEQNKNY